MSAGPVEKRAWGSRSWDYSLGDRLWVLLGPLPQAAVGSWERGQSRQQREGWGRETGSSPRADWREQGG